MENKDLRTEDVIEDLKEKTEDGIDKAEDIKADAKAAFEEGSDKAEDFAEDFVEGTKKVVKDVAKTAKTVYHNTADKVEEVMKDERVVEFKQKTAKALDSGAKTVVATTKKGAQIAKEKTDDFLTNPKVVETYENVSEKATEVGSKIVTGIKGLFSKKSDVVDDVEKTTDDFKEEVEEDTENKTKIYM